MKEPEDTDWWGWAKEEDGGREASWTKEEWQERSSSSAEPAASWEEGRGWRGSRSQSSSAGCYVKGGFVDKEGKFHGYGGGRHRPRERGAESSPRDSDRRQSMIKNGRGIRSAGMYACVC